MSEADSSQTEDAESSGPTVRDRRRIDPETYQVREPQTAAPAPGATNQPGPAGGPDGPEKESAVVNSTNEVETALAERTADLQRLQAEYVNYKRRVDRDRDVSRRGAIESVLRDLLPVLDDIASAGEHGELTGGFKAVTDELTKVTRRYGLESFGTKGDAFDPHIHEALLHSHAPDVTGPTCVEILQPGYRVAERVLRPARVAVAEPDPNGPAAADGDAGTSTGTETGAADAGAADAGPTGPEPAASRPEPSASRPEPSASRPEPSASRPEASASRPEASASRPEPVEGQGSDA